MQKESGLPSNVTHSRENGFGRGFSRLKLHDLLVNLCHSYGKWSFTDDLPGAKVFKSCYFPWLWHKFTKGYPLVN